ncbi:hypothetical protein [Pseudomonas sp. Irchel 3E20]|uniref:hypothetical protein n=1 Tax=Pseudomonas sp. Irchel 3E20 TaxID=2008983 RepID=UPI000BA32719|nr:hypothetical protein [Pseudomonas sp. Irchel 3E20]
MGNNNKRLNRLLLTGCVLSAMYCLPVVAAGDGTIVLTRPVDPIAAGRKPLAPNPNPTTVNANPSQQVLRATGELSDGDFAGVSSGQRIQQTVNNTAPTHMPGLNVVTNPNGLPGMGASAGSGAGARISGTINRAMETGMRPLMNLGGKGN